MPLDTSEIETYLSTLQNMDMTEYMTYNATQEDLETYGLADPELTMEIDYTTTDEDDNETSGTFVLSVSHDPSQPLPEESESEATQDESEETEEEEITAYARVGESPIVYNISTDAYKALMASSIDDFRHKEVVPANFENIAQIDIVLEDVNYTISSKGEGDDRTYYYGDEELEIDELQSALQALSADSFTDEEPTDVYKRQTLDLNSAMLRCHGNEIRLSAKEFDMMRLLLQAREHNVSKEFLLSRVWGYDSNAVENHVEVYIGFLRKKLAGIGSNIRIEAIRRLGYHLEVSGDD